MNSPATGSEGSRGHTSPPGLGAVRLVLRRFGEQGMPDMTASSGSLSATAVVVVVAMLFAGCSLRRGTLDLTGGQSSTCGLHQEAMTKQRVELDYGMKRDLESELDRARAEHFPNADEPFDTRNCLPSRERYARIWVCLRCTEARDTWLSAHSSTSK